MEGFVFRLFFFFLHKIKRKMIAFDTLWDYSQPAATRAKFLALLNDEEVKNNLSIELQVKTQIARTYSLQFDFENANEWLHKVELTLPADENSLEHIRYHLERGRTFNTANQKSAALPHFQKAFELANAINADFFAIDAAHMLAIVAEPIAALLWNEKAIMLAENSTNEKAKNWLGSLYNNLGWSFFDMKNYDSALNIFQKAYEWRLEKKQLMESLIGKWCIGRTLRAKGLVEEALALQLELEKEYEANNIGKDGYVIEEIAECYLLLGNPIAKTYFAQAHELLVNDIYLSKNEKARLDRLKALAV